jgi:hypothetical protein
MKKAFTTMFFALGTLANVLAQTEFQWVKKYGTNGKNESITSTAMDNSNNLYVLGTYYNNTQLDGQNLTQDASSDGKGFFVSKMDNAGQIQWVKSYRQDDWIGTDNPVMAVAADGSCFIAASFRGNITIGNHTLNSGSNSFGGTSILVAKLDASGNEQWAVRFEAKKGHPRHITLDLNGNILLAGIFNENINFNGGTTLSAWSGLSSEAFIVKLNPVNGSAFWAKKTESKKQSEIKTIVTDNNGYIYVGGFHQHDSVRFSPNVAFGFYEIPGSTTTSNNRRNAFFAKYDSNGNFVWAKHIKGELDGEINFTYANNALYASVNNGPQVNSIGGYFIYDTDTVLYSIGKNALLKINPLTGDKNFHKETTGFINSLTSDNKGSIFFSSTGDFTWRFDAYTNTSGKPGIAVAKLDNADNFQWVEMRGGTGNTIGGMALYAQNNQVFVGGFMRGISDVNFEQNITISPGEASYEDGWYGILEAKTTTGISSVKHSGFDFQIYPNPANDFVVVSDIPSSSIIKITDITGKTVYYTRTTNEKILLNTTQFINGIYHVRIENKGSIVNKKLIVTK